MFFCVVRARFGLVIACLLSDQCLACPITEILGFAMNILPNPNLLRSPIAHPNLIC